MASRSHSVWCFALVVVRHEGRFLVVQERKHGQLWYLPAGRVEPGETFREAALRETLEESGVVVDVSGIVRVEHSPGRDGVDRMRVIFVGEPAGSTEPKSHADEHSLQARWVTLEELESMPLRGPEVRDLIHHVQAGHGISPLTVLDVEGAPFPADRPEAVELPLVILAVDDLIRSNAFYETAFGWPRRVTAPVYIEFDLGRGRGLGLYQRIAFGANTTEVPHPIPSGCLAPTELYFRCENSTRVVRQIEGAGGRLLSPLAPRPWGETVAYLSDPDGNVLAIASTKGN